MMSSFVQRQQQVIAINGWMIPALDSPIRPAHLDTLDNCFIPKTEMNRCWMLRPIRISCHNLSHLPASRSVNSHLTPDGRIAGLAFMQVKSNPVSSVGQPISKNMQSLPVAGPYLQGRQDEIHFSIVIKIFTHAITT